MISSMTGFGSARLEDELNAVCVEARAVNSRGFKLIDRLAERLLGQEARIERIVREYVRRGAVHLTVYAENIAGDTGYVVDSAVAEAYRGQLVELKERLGLAGAVTLSDLLSLPGLVQKRQPSDDAASTLWALVERAVRQAMAALSLMREEEGRFLWEELVGRTVLIESMVDEVEARAPVMVAEYRDRLNRRLAALLDKLGQEVRLDDIHREIALFTDRSDITEEIQRIRSHMAQLRDTGDADEPVGRKLEFIVQEMFREANTMGSKAHDPEMTRQIVEIKTELEKLKEQALNVE